MTASCGLEIRASFLFRDFRDRRSALMGNSTRSPGSTEDTNFMKYVRRLVSVTLNRYVFYGR